MQPSLSLARSQVITAGGNAMESLSRAEPQFPVRRYSNVAVTFHWVTVALVLAQAYFGLAFSAAEPGPVRIELFTWHKTIGAVILLTTLGRLAYRLNNPPPPYPPDLPQWERVSGTWTHRLFYFLLILMPLSGLMAVSARTEGPTTPLIGGIPLPVIPGVSERVGDLAGGLHVALVFVLLLAIVIHASAALKHQFFDHTQSAGRMPPFKPAGDEHPVVGQGRSGHPELAQR
jgi:cytochrome b561